MREGRREGNKRAPRARMGPRVPYGHQRALWTHETLCTALVETPADEKLNSTVKTFQDTPVTAVDAKIATDTIQTIGRRSKLVDKTLMNSAITTSRDVLKMRLRSSAHISNGTFFF